MTGKDLYLRLLGYLKSYRKAFAAAIVFIILFALTEPILPYLLQPLIDGNFAKVNQKPAYEIPLLIVALFLLRGILHFGGQYLMAWVSQKVVMDLRNQMFTRLTLLPLSFFNREKTGNLISRFTFNVSQVAEASTEVLVILVRDSITILGLLLFLLYTSWQLSLFILLVAPIVALLIKLVSKRLRYLSHSTQDNMGRITHVLEEAIKGNTVMKIFAGEQYEKSRFYKVSNYIRRFFVKTVSTAAASFSIIQLFNALAVSLVIYFALLQSDAGKLSTGEFVSFLGALAMLWPSVKRITEVNVKLQRGLAAAESVFALLDEPEEQDKGKLELATVKGDIEIENLNFSYPDKDVAAILDVSLKIRAGQSVALVGESGSGKSSLIRLLPRLYEYDVGTIRIDGIDLKDLNLKSLRQNISFVSQEINLFNDTVKANIAYGALDKYSDDEIINAAKNARAFEFIDKLPDKFNTNIGSDGVLLSGGQRQRIAIARALLKDAPILILDEATSALDQVLEQQIKNSIANNLQNKTVIIVTHRLNSIKNVDKIFVFADGSLVESGKHAALIEANGVYAGLYTADAES